MRSTKHRILITGANGQLGRAFVSSLDNDDSFDVHACGHSDLDIRDEKAVSQAITDFGIDILVNCAAYTAVDAAEDHPEEAYAVNHKAVAAIAYACNHLGVKLVHFSTDYVFDGQTDVPISNQTRLHRSMFMANLNWRERLLHCLYVRMP